MSVLRGVVLCVVFSFLLEALIAQNADTSGSTDIMTGEGYQALLFPGSGGVELSGGLGGATLSKSLPITFTFEAWVMLPQTPADGYYKTMVSRWDIGPDLNFHNRWSDFDFQVQASGNLNFFMGNGLPSTYGILIDCGLLFQTGVWAHVAFSVSNARGGPTPDIVTVYFNDLEFSQSWLSGNAGSRQIPSSGRNRNFFLGDYFNQDGDHKYWRGYMDEVRFWSTVRSSAQLKTFGQRVVPYNSVGLVAYYRFNDGTGSILFDSTVNAYNGFLQRLTPSVSAPQWTLSGAKIHVDVNSPAQRSVTFGLPGLSTKGALGFTYIITSLPQLSTLIADGQFITRTPWIIQGNGITVRFGSDLVDTFTYYGTFDPANPLSREREDTIVYLNGGAGSGVLPEPGNNGTGGGNGTNGGGNNGGGNNGGGNNGGGNNGGGNNGGGNGGNNGGNGTCVFDACGICNGDGSSCSCLPLPFAGYNLTDIERVLVLYEIEQTLQLLHAVDHRIDLTLASLTQHQPSELGLLVKQVQSFFTECLVPFCERVDFYIQELRAL